MTRRSAVGAVGVALVLVVVSWAIIEARRPRPERVLELEVRPAAPAFSLDNVEPHLPRVDLASYQGKPVVLNFWASWCVPCVREMPELEAASRALRGRAHFVGINYQDGISSGRELLQKTGVTYPSARDPKVELAGSFGLRGMPTTVFIDAAGRIAARRTGELRRAEIEEQVARLLAQREARVGA